jgi:hypothetical protein
MTVIFGVDRHKSTHAVVAIGRDERPLARVRLVAERCQTQRLLAWVEPLGTEADLGGGVRWGAGQAVGSAAGGAG